MDDSYAQPNFSLLVLHSKDQDEFQPQVLVKTNPPRSNHACVRLLSYTHITPLRVNHA